MGAPPLCSTQLLVVQAWFGGLCSCFLATAHPCHGFASPKLAQPDSKGKGTNHGGPAWLCHLGLLHHPNPAAAPPPSKGFAWGWSITKFYNMLDENMHSHPRKHHGKGVVEQVVPGFGFTLKLGNLCGHVVCLPPCWLPTKACGMPLARSCVETLLHTASQAWHLHGGGFTPRCGLVVLPLKGPCRSELPKSKSLGIVVGARQGHG